MRTREWEMVRRYLAERPVLGQELAALDSLRTQMEQDQARIERLLAEPHRCDDCPGDVGRLAAEAKLARMEKLEQLLVLDPDVDWKSMAKQLFEAWDKADDAEAKLATAEREFDEKDDIINNLTDDLEALQAKLALLEAELREQKVLALPETAVLLANEKLFQESLKIAERGRADHLFAENTRLRAILEGECPHCHFALDHDPDIRQTLASDPPLLTIPSGSNQPMISYADYQALEAEVSSLVGALERYGSHEQACRSRSLIGDEIIAPQLCDCGYLSHLREDVPNAT